MRNCCVAYWAAADQWVILLAKRARGVSGQCRARMIQGTMCISGGKVDNGADRPAVVQVMTKAAAAETRFERLSEALGAEKQTCKALRAELLSTKTAAEAQLSRLRIELDAKQVSGMPGNCSRPQGCAPLAITCWQQPAADNTTPELCLFMHCQPGCLHPSSVPGQESLHPSSGPGQECLHPSSGPGPGRELRDTAGPSSPLLCCMSSQTGLLVRKAETHASSNRGC